MVVVGALRGDSAAAVTDELFGGGEDLQGFFDDAVRAARTCRASSRVPAVLGCEMMETKVGSCRRWRLLPRAARTAGGGELEWLLNKDAFPTVDTMAPPAEAGLATALPRTTKVVASSPPPAVSPRPRAPAKAGRRCGHCGTDETPQWRKGPEGAPSLCNACGMRYRAGKLLPEYRPAKSPTFSPVLHSNKHHRVVQLARRREEESAKTFPAAAGD
ncbi:hypothetical protein EJB05_22086, partial [Eragrostis curvula]